MRKIVSVLFIFLVLLSCGSEDLTKVAFVSGQYMNETEIYVTAADGTDEIRLTFNDWEDTFPCWSHDNSQIAFKSQRDGSEELYIMASDGTDHRRVTYFNKQVKPGDSKLYVGPNCWSIDGKTIVFSFEDTIYKVAPDITNLVPYPQTGEAPGFSPDGNYISFTSMVNNSYHLYVMDLESTTLKEILSFPYGLPNCSSWSPDSKKLVCTQNSDLFVVDVDSGEITLLDSASTSQDAVVFGADWGPKGNKILYSVREGDLEGSLQYFIEVKSESSSLLTPRLFTGLATWSNKK